jgi:hypothetical protein
MPDQIEYNLYWRCVRICLDVFETSDLFRHESLNMEAEQLLENQTFIELLKFQEEIELNLR